MPWWLSECSMRSHSSWARASTSVVGHLDLSRRATTASSTASRNSASTRASSASRSLAAMSSRSSSSVSKPAASEAKSSSSVGQVLALDLLDRDRELAPPCRPARSRRSRRGSVTVDRALVAGLRAHELLLEAGHEAPGAELDELVAALAAGEGLAVDRADVVHDDEVAARRRRRPRRSPGARCARAAPRARRRRPRRRRPARACRPRRPCTRRASPSGARRSRS